MLGHEQDKQHQRMKLEQSQMFRIIFLNKSEREMISRAKKR